MTYAMIGEYKIDEIKLLKLLRLRQYRFFLIRIPVIILIGVFGILIGENSILVVAGILILLTIIGYLLTPFIYRQKNDSINKLTIELNNIGILRKGDGLVATEITFKDIGQIKERRDGIHVFRRGIINHFIFHSGKYDGLIDLDIIWIPRCIENYDKIFEFIYSKVE